MAVKTWKIGEYCVGGVIKAKTSEDKKSGVIFIDIKIEDYYDGSEVATNLFNTEFDGSLLEYPIENWLCEYTTSYYAGKVISWIKDKL